jgi:hypothetical protein
MPKVQKIEPQQYPEAVRKLRGFTGIILVHHPSCGHCINLRSDWEQSKKQTNPRVQIMEINGEGMSENPMMANSVAGKNTEGFPTIMGLRNGKLESKFNEERTVPNMVKFANKFISGAIQTIKTIKKSKIGKTIMKKNKKTYQKKSRKTKKYTRK